jgi:serine protease Do
MNAMCLNFVRMMIAVMLLATMPFAHAGIPVPPGQAQQTSLAPMLKKVMPGVVNVSTKSRVSVQQNPLFNDPFFRRFFNVPDMPKEQDRQSLGSGVIVDADKGYILTNNHVIENAQEITVTLRDGRHFKAKVVGADPGADLAVLEIKAKKLTAVPFGDSTSLEVGDFVVAIGNPFGLGQTVTSGIVSALGRSGLGIEGYEDFIQTDASINPGNSGGALVNLDGRLIGINTAIVGPSGGNVGIGFAIPSDMAKKVMNQLIRYGSVHRGQLGVYIQDVTPDLVEALGVSNASGAAVTRVVKGSPADKAGLKAGDVITAINGEPMKTSSQLRNTIGLLRVGAKVTIDYLRNGKARQVKAVIAEPKQEKADAGKFDKRLSGAVVSTAEPGTSPQGESKGVEILSVEQGSPAWSAGLRKGDVIVSVNRQPVKTPEDLRKALKRKPSTILLNIHRGEAALFIAIQ